MPETVVEEACTSPSTVRSVTDGITALLQPVVDAGRVAQSVVAQQQRLHQKIEALNEELEKARMHFNALNDVHRRKLGLYSAKIARCRANVAVLLRQLSEIKERLLRVHSVLLQRKLKHPAENAALKEELPPTAFAQDNVAVTVFATEEVESSTWHSKQPEEV
ncbi:hypothetical protein TraAM80_08319 [Trypanosoma rangeli]|uniref:Biogenesis of lysosome-related organelles complex 1 subunit 7 n=1 Tax=Trypanosoma rangeli TaxID=5698 RepID=A0A3R7M4D8_TRYRA|nr:uncharacterized protein TraAM80_08319 [Trypanosoma rangeli]RNE99216.1 hypothetical protein TraAM80_08319 [Trypanosoma rangeli]|eukprot:RNE99216.1 hypothetical protein TraAM80_08319 [Trypanosoma rangeli]